MVLGEKIKAIRKSKKLTQQDIAGERITRNMLSAIECGKASPSLDTLSFIAERLGVPVAYFISDEDELFHYKKRQLLDDIKSSLRNKMFLNAISLIESIHETDDELAYILAVSHTELLRQCVLSGALLSAQRHLDKATKYCSETVYDTSRQRILISLYGSLAKNIQSPMLELDSELYCGMLAREVDYELYMYVVGDNDYQFRSSIFSKHKRAKALMKERKYTEALNLMNEIIEEKNPENYNAHVIFLVYTDMEICSKQLMDFESAYKYASKRLSMIEGFKT